MRRTQSKNILVLQMRAGYILLLFFFFTNCQQKKEISAGKKNNLDWALLNFTKLDSLNPILQPSNTQIFNCPVSKSTVMWEEKNVLNPSAIVRQGKVYLIYRAQDKKMTSRLGLAISDDGSHFVKQPEPVLFPDEDSMKKYEWSGGIEDPRVIETEDGSYIMTYTSYDGKTARLCLASSKDLKSWIKHGLVLKGEKYKNTWSKSGAIIARQSGDKIIATKIKGKYWMYFGDTDLFIATSDDLIHWEIAENAESKKMISVLHARMGYFDSRLVEPGPYALIRNGGILLIYNGSNAANFNDSTLPKFTYSAGQALFDKNGPYKLIARTDSSFIRPDKPYEKIGEVNEVCFVEGLVHYKNKWFLYYGTADSKIAVAVREGE
jgi:beta-1,2-mannosidase